MPSPESTFICKDPVLCVVSTTHRNLFCILQIRHALFLYWYQLFCFACCENLDFSDACCQHLYSFYCQSDLYYLD